MVLPALSRGGAERQCITLVKELKDNGWKVDLLLLKDIVEWEKKELEDFNDIFLFGIKNSVRLFNSKYKVRLYWMSIPILIGRLLLSRKNRFTVRASNLNPKLSFLFRITRYFSGKTSFNSKYSAEKYIENKWVNKSRNLFIPNYIRGLDENVLCNKNSTSENCLNIAMIAHWRINKDHITLFEGIKNIDSKVNIKLHLFGDLGPNSEMVELAKIKGVYERCVFHGIVDNPWDLVKPDINILSSHYEGTPNAIMEGCKLGIPYVMTNIPELSYLHDTLKGGVLFEKRDPKDFATKIQLLVDDTSKRMDLGESGQKNLIKFFNKQSITKLWLNFLCDE